MTFLCHSSLIRSISASNIGSDAVRNVAQPIIPYKIAILSNKVNTSRLMYYKLVSAMNKHHTNTSVYKKWCRDVGCMNEGTLKDIRLSSRNTYLQTFHYRMVKRIISTNTFLFRLGKSDTPLCTFCGLVDETLYHILWGCEVAQTFLNEVITYMKDTYDVTIQFTVQSWFFPRITEEGQLNILIITLTKLVIFKSKYQKGLPSIQHLHSLLRLEAEKEHKCARSDKLLHEFTSKWGNVTKILTNSFDGGLPNTPPPPPLPVLPIVPLQTGDAGDSCRRRSPGGRSRDAPVSVVPPAQPVRRDSPVCAAGSAPPFAGPLPRLARWPVAEAHPT